jgi:hypothetical protein
MVELGELVGPTYAVAPGESCAPERLVPIEADSTFHAVVLGAAPASLFPALEPELVGTGSARLDALTTSTGVLLPFGGLFDVERDVRCEATRFDDGVYRCVPANELGGLGSPEWFLDDQCSTVAYVSRLPCASTRFVSVTADPQTLCDEGAIRAVFEARPTTAPLFTRVDDGSCIPGVPDGTAFELTVDATATLPVLTRLP